jgi:hypothetical protein
MMNQTRQGYLSVRLLGTALRDLGTKHRRVVCRSSGVRLMRFITLFKICLQSQLKYSYYIIFVVVIVGVF